MNILGVIPARGGSKGVPGKNVRELSGKPLLAYTIEAAKNSAFLNRIIVSTDDDEIGEVAARYGAEVIKRPAYLALDETPTEPVIFHVVDRLENEEGWAADIVVLLQPTSPFRDSRVIDECVNKIIKEGYDSVLTACKDAHFFWKLEKDEATALYDYKNRPRRQDMKTNLRENGAVYAARKQILEKEQNRLGGKIGLVEMEEMDSIEIDTPFDMWLAEKIKEFKEMDYERA